jgi:hypothetical protein
VDSGLFVIAESVRDEKPAAGGILEIVHRRLRVRNDIQFHDVHVAAGTTRAQNDAARGKREKLTFWSIAAAIVLPVILAAALVAMDMRADLSQLKSTGLVDDRGAVPVAWPDLRDHGDFPGRVRILGYMVHEQMPIRDGERVDIFLLLPEAGHFLRQPRRTPNQTVVVWSSYPVFFRNRELVWASGTLSRAIRRSGKDQPEWAMTFAEVSPAADRDIGRWLRP